MRTFSRNLSRLLITKILNHLRSTRSVPKILELLDHFRDNDITIQIDRDIGDRNQEVPTGPELNRIRRGRPRGGAAIPHRTHGMGNHHLHELFPYGNVVLGEVHW